MEKAKRPANLDEGVEIAVALLRDKAMKGDSAQRLRESGFFLSKMVDTYMKSNDFSHYMTAFIMLSRSFMWILHKEYKNAEGFEEWYDAKEPPKRLKAILDNITTLRNNISHVSPLKLRMKVEVTLDTRGIRNIDNIESMTEEEIINLLQERYEGQDVVILTEEEAKEIAAKNKALGVRGKVEPVAIEHEDFSDILRQCKLYFLFLTVIYTECVLKFGIPSLKIDPSPSDRDISFNW